MGTATIPATLLSLALVGWLGTAAVCAAAPAARNQGTSPPLAQTSQVLPPQGAPAEPADRAASVAVRNAAQPTSGREKRRRTSYASCNRESHRRNLRGGARRRFLIRCRLGYERRQQPAAQGGAQGGAQSRGQIQVQGQPPARRP